MTASRPCVTSPVTVARRGDFAFATTSARVRDCTECSATGLLRGRRTENGRDYDIVVPCPRAALEARIQAFNAAHIPSVHAQARLTSFQPQFTEDHRGYDVATKFVHTYQSARSRERENVPVPRGFILSGPVGTGKSHLLCATLTELALEKGIPVEYVEISFLYKEIRRGFNEGRSGGEIIQPLAQVEVLAIDELGKGRGSAFEMDTLDELIARRYNAGRATLFATNYSLRPAEDRLQRGYVGTDQLVEATKESRLIADRVGDRIYSRLQEMCEFVEFRPETVDKRRATTTDSERFRTSRPPHR